VNRRTALIGALLALAVQPALVGKTMVMDLPVPKWRPSFSQPLDRVEDRFSYYFNHSRDFAVLQNGTCVLLDDGLSDGAASVAALGILSHIINYHPDMQPSPMDDGNVLVG
jgi:hypothetical protein